MRVDVDREGKFRFGGVRAGSYWLTATITGFLDVRRSVEVRPSLADESGNILLRLIATAVRDEAQHTVSVNDLEIPEEAQREYRRAVDAGGDFEKVRAHLERAIELAPHFDEALNNLGTTYHREGNYEKSIELFERALAANPDSFYPRVNMGGSLLAAGHLERALEENTKAVDLRPDSSLANAQLGMSLFFLRRDEEAIPYFERAKELDEFSLNTPELYLSDIYLRNGDPTRAAEELERFLERLPDHPRAPMVRERLRQFKSVPSPPF
jgi:tetratricopeptide (TPR) repeat protein